MLTYLRQHVATTLAPAHSATLATSGPAGLQADLFPCVARGTLLYLLLPCTSDQLLNLDSDPQVVVTAAGWQVRGWARVLDPAEQPAIDLLMDEPGAPWSLVVEVHPTRVTIAQRQGWGAAETIDLE
jgi:hypothetical protein